MAHAHRPVIDADGHVFESDRDIFPYLPAPFKGQELLFATPFFPALDGFHRQARRVLDGRVGLFDNPDATEWLDYLTDADITLSVLFPTAGLAFGLISDPDWAAGLARGYNDWLYDQFLQRDPRRLKGMALIPVQDPARGAAELRHAVHDLGYVGGVLPAAGLREALGAPQYWPIYEAAQDLNCVLAIHGAPSYGLGLESLHRLIEVRTLTHGFGQMLQMTSLMFEGVFDAFPRLRFAFCEAGVGWVPYLMERLDMEFGNRRGQAPGLKCMPSEHLRSGRIYFHTELGEHGLARAIEDLGEDIFFCASDFPHEPKQEFLEVLDEFEERVDVPDSVKPKILWDNPIRLYALDESQLV